jgi:TolB protein
VKRAGLNRILVVGASAIVAFGASGCAGTDSNTKGGARRVSRLIAVGMGSGHRNFDIWLVSPEGKRVRRLTRDPGVDVLPTWAPDGSRLAYLCRFEDDSENLNGVAGGLGDAIDFGPLGHHRNSAGSLCLVNADGSRLRVLVKRMGAAAPAWSPDGSKLAFARPNNGIYVIRVDGTGLRRLATGDDDYPAWSPDGRRIVYTTDDGLWIMNANGARPRRLTSGGDDLGPAWSPDGSTIAFTRFTDSGREVRVVSPDGRDNRRLATSSGGVLDPNVGMDPVPAGSPDGEQLAFDVGNDQGVSSIGVVGAHGRGLRIYKHNHDGDFHPTWSPDGTSLAVTSWLAKGEGLGLLSLPASGPPRIVVPRYNTTPAWRPRPRG